MNIYSIHDSAAKYYLPIFLARTDDEATRMFIQAMDHNYVHRGDYTLGLLGTFDHNLGELKTQDFAKIINGLSLPDTAFPPDPRQNSLPGIGVNQENPTPTEELQS